jgi:hypothetical protein
MKLDRIKLIIFFIAGFAVGLLMNYNLSAEEGAKVVMTADYSQELEEINIKLDAVLANQELLAKEQKRIFARIH